MLASAVAALRPKSHLGWGTSRSFTREREQRVWDSSHVCGGDDSLWCHGRRFESWVDDSAAKPEPTPCGGVMYRILLPGEFRIARTGRLS